MAGGGNWVTEARRASGTLVPLPRPQPEPEPLADPRRGDVDEWGRSESMRAVARRLYRPVYQRWFRVDWEGLDKIPTSGGATLTTCWSPPGRGSPGYGPITSGCCGSGRRC